MKVKLLDYLNQTFKTVEKTGVFLVSIDKKGKPNVMTIGWLLLGLHYYKKPVAVVALLPDRHTFKLLNEVEEFVLAIPTPEFEEALVFCGEKTGRDTDKIREIGVTTIASVYVKPPSFKECIVNIECRIYNKILPPQNILKPEWKECTVYFAEILGVFKY
jgi:flavin reductase (DIM6/NTAB) family NADH-FMN oxidoreductase RutF